MHLEADCFMLQWLVCSQQSLTNCYLVLDRTINLLLVSFSGDKLVRATELVKLLSLEKSVRGAIKLVTALKLPNLAERFNTLLEVGQDSQNSAPLNLYDI